METFDYIVGIYENYNSIGGNGGIANDSICIVNKGGYYIPYYYDKDETTNDHSNPHPSICPHCGAPTKPHLNSCEYCDVYFD